MALPQTGYISTLMTLLNISVALNFYKFLQHDWFHFKGLEKHILAEFIMEKTSTLGSLIHKLSLIYYWHLFLDPVVARLEKQPQWFKLKMIWVWHDCFEFESHCSNLFRSVLMLLWSFWKSSKLLMDLFWIQKIRFKFETGLYCPSWHLTTLIY